MWGKRVGRVALAVIIVSLGSSGLLQGTGERGGVLLKFRAAAPAGGVASSTAQVPVRGSERLVEVCPLKGACSTLPFTLTVQLGTPGVTLRCRTADSNALRVLQAQVTGNALRLTCL